MMKEGVPFDEVKLFGWQVAAIPGKQTGLITPVCVIGSRLLS
jgi:hypothetical protein